MNTHEKHTKNLQTYAVLGMQWGDEGKGKVVDLLASTMDAVVRFGGGNNAGHTVKIDNETFILHLLPSGILDCKGVCLLGAGVVVDLSALAHELDLLSSKKELATLLIDARSHLIMPYHVALDEAYEAQRAQPLGTTKKGIGPAYADKMNREGMRAEALFDLALFEHQFKEGTKRANVVLTSLGAAPMDAEASWEAYAPFAMRFASHVCDGAGMLHDAIKDGKRVLFEGAQAAMLDIDHGHYPFVTSSSPTVAGAAIGTGISADTIRTRIGILKAYSTRVGAGPMPTEDVGAVGKLLQKQGNEIGATTGRIRRCGYLDLVVARHAMNLNGFTHVALTKLDVLSGVEDLKLAYAYRHKGKRIVHMPPSMDDSFEPEYQSFESWNEDISRCQSFDALPQSAKRYVSAIEDMLGVRISMISLGPERTQNLIRPEGVRIFGL